jgi:hypothetical protein
MDEFQIYLLCKQKIDHKIELLEYKGLVAHVVVVEAWKWRVLYKKLRDMP